MNVKLTKVYRKSTDKDGNVLVARDGREYTRLAIKTVQHGDKWISGFDNDTTSSWNVGDTVDIIVTENGKYFNFSVAKKDDKIISRLDELEKRIVKLEEFYFKHPEDMPDDSDMLPETEIAPF